jgi:zinc protease
MSPVRLLLAVLVLSVTTAASATTFEKKLDNGMTVIVKEDHRAPTVVHMVWYRVGAIDEKDGTSGVAHMLEHMMFKGTPKAPGNTFNRVVAEAGGRDNAFTGQDYTAYFQIVPKAALPRMMELEADRMANLRLNGDDFAAENKVVIEERRLRTEDNPQARVHEALHSAMFTAHPYRRPVIGWMDDLGHMTWQDAHDWYRQWYVPNNAFLVVVGDVKAAEVFKMAERNYGRVAARPLPARRIPDEPEQTGVRRVTVKAPAKLPYLAMSWKMPKLVDVEHDRDPYALEVLAAVLDGNDAARLPKNLVRGQKLAQSVGAGYDSTTRGIASFTLVGQPADGHRADELEAALLAELKRVQEEGITEAELARVKSNLVAAQVYKRDSMMAQAMEIGGFVASGLQWQDFDKVIDKLRTVTADEVQGVARRYFGEDGLTVATLDPLPLDKAPVRRSGVTLRH